MTTLTSIRKNIRKTAITSLTFTMLTVILPQSSPADNQWTYFTKTGPVTAMAASGSTVWCGTQFGLVRWNTDDMSYYILRVPDGLPHAHIVDIDIAVDGSTWVATGENGMAHYDGSSWRSYTTDDGLPYSHGLAIEAADDGTVYAGTYMPYVYDQGGGLARFDNGAWTWTRFSTMGDNAKNFVYDIAAGADGSVWTACGGKLASVADSTWTFHDMSASFILFDTAGTLWIHTGTGLVTSTDGEFEDVTLPDGFNGSAILKPCAAPDSSVVFLTVDGGLFRIASDRTQTVLKTGGGESRFTAVTVDETGAIWAGLADGGLARFENGGWSEFALDEVTIGDSVNALGSDRNGDVWAASDGGLFRYASRSWDMVVSGENAPDYGNDPAFTLTFDTDGTLWLLGYYDGAKNIRRLDDQGNLVTDPTLDVYGGVFRAVADIHDGLWLSFREKTSMFRYENGRLSEIQTPESVSDTLFPIAVDPEGGIWCRSYIEYKQLFYRYFNGEWEPHQEVYISAYESGVTSMGFGPDGTVWVSVTDNHGTTHWPSCDSRILRMTPDGSSFVEAFRLETASVLHCVDNEGRLWLSRHGFEDSDYYGTHYYGLARYDGESIEYIRETEGLSDDRVRDIFADSGNGIWVATNRGLCRITDETTGVDEDTAVPATFDILSVHPNPFNPSTTIRMNLPERGFTSLTVYSITGQKVRNLVAAPLAAGEHRFVWDGRDDSGSHVSSGMYIAAVRNGARYDGEKMTLLR